ncbi:hypothetical protein CHM34_11180 [Paludifilum halophilum]|uniref:Uncharacterized protein n=1 Tax=Paludifilum halophilum TaxID=1642702 RepID=A0A235B6E5_9BACL|nr:hypothetical protein CHM34_11180 [Paludifilum halophilum]
MDLQTLWIPRGFYLLDIDDNFVTLKNRNKLYIYSFRKVVRGVEFWVKLLAIIAAVLTIIEKVNAKEAEKEKDLPQTSPQA